MTKKGTAVFAYGKPALKVQKYLLDELGKGAITTYGELDEKRIFVQRGGIIVFVMYKEDFLLTGIDKEKSERVSNCVGTWFKSLGDEDNELFFDYHMERQYKDYGKAKIDVYKDRDGNQYHFNSVLLAQFGKPADRRVFTTKREANQPAVIQGGCIVGILAPLRPGFIPANKEAK